MRTTRFRQYSFTKGLHKQVFENLDKAKQSALELDENHRFENHRTLWCAIESSLLPGSIDGRADELIQQSSEVSLQNQYAT